MGKERRWLKRERRKKKRKREKKFFFFKQKTAYEIKECDWSSDVCSSDLFLEKNGFEVGIHGLYHDGKKFNSREIFMKRAKIINRYLEEWGAVGFRAPSMHCNLDWIGELDIEYDMSTFDTDPFEPNSIGVRNIYPFMVSRLNGRSEYVEMPYTLPQDSTLFILLGERNVDIWKKKLDWISEKGGMALLNTHPDYMVFDSSMPGIDEYPCDLYEEFLGYVRETYNGQYYHALPRELARYFIKRNTSTAKNIK